MTENKLKHLKICAEKMRKIELSLFFNQGLVTITLDDESREFVKNAVIEAIDNFRQELK